MYANQKYSSFNGSFLQSEYGFRILHQELSIKVDFESQLITGVTEISINPTCQNLRQIKLHFRGDNILGIKVNNVKEIIY